MSCPFKHLWVTSPAEGEKETASKIDLAHESNGVSVSEAKQAEADDLEHDVDTSAQPSGGGCPFGHGTRNAQAPNVPASTSPSAQGAPATCPLGFGSSAGPKFSNLHCIICK